MVGSDSLQVKHHTALQDWEGLRPHIHFPGYLKYFSWRSTSVLPRRASTYFLIQQLELACYIAAAFLRAHRMTRNHLRDFIGTSLVFTKIPNVEFRAAQVSNVQPIITCKLNTKFDVVVVGSVELIFI